MNPIELHEVTKAALASHWQACPYRCTTNHIKCVLGWRLIRIEEDALKAARMAALGINGSTETDPQPVPHEPCCTTVRATAELVVGGGTG